jgi:hypothetical protein
VRARSKALLATLDNYPDAVLVAGCQRSGTTAVTRILKEALGMPDIGFTRDDELDAALILSGTEHPDYAGRYCFQTTYLNERVAEYAQHNDYRLTWVIRNPHDVVRSMMHNWRRGALRRLFHKCGAKALDDKEQKIYSMFGSLPFSRLRMACLSYNIKSAQIHYLADILTPERLFLVDYDELLADRESILPRIFKFHGIDFDESYVGRLKRPRRGRSHGLSTLVARYVTETCQQEYDRARDLQRKWSDTQMGRVQIG